MRWIEKQISNDPSIQSLVEQLSTNTPFPEPLANILVQRSYDRLNKVRDYFKPSEADLHDPDDMKDMDKALVRIMLAVDRKEKILVYGDYDVDGTTSVSLLCLFFRDWGIPVDYYIPDRYKEGYGLSYEGIGFAAKNNFSLLIALDCGTKAVDKSKVAKGRGIDLVIVDHHQPGAQLPICEAMLNPLQDGCAYPCKVLSACGLTLKLCQALNLEFRSAWPGKLPSEDYDPFHRFCDLATLSIASDIVPITGENRTIAAFGLEKIRAVPLPGIAALMALSPNQRKWTISDLVFFLGPRINSAGRIYSAKAAVKLFMGEPGEAEIFAKSLHSYNDERKELDKNITEEAIELIENDAVERERASTVLFQEHWHKGVIGIVASRLIERFYRPTIMLTKSGDKWVGSARSVIGFDLYKALEACQEHIVQFGGHKYAAGMTISESSIHAFKDKFEKVVSSSILPDQKIPELEIAHRLKFTEINPKFIRLLRRFAPFGPGNPEPIFLSTHVEIKEFRILKEDHLKLNLYQNGVDFEAIGFNLARKWENLNPKSIHLAYQVDLKTWKGVTYVQLVIKDFKVAWKDDHCYGN